MATTNVTAERLRELLDYNPNTGVLRWRVSVGSRAKAGDITGSKTAQGRLTIRVDGRAIFAHHIAWIVTNGALPDGVLRHLNGDTTDNRIANLVAVTRRDVISHLVSRRIDAANVHDIFEYTEGRILWKTTTSGRRISGREAGYISDDGYIVVEVKNKATGAHRIVWLMHHGAWPDGEIDHINGIRNDNRIENLRDVGHKTNSENRRGASTRSITGILGVSAFKGGKFRARIRTSGRVVSLGLFDTTEQAHAAYVNAKRRLHVGCTL